MSGKVIATRPRSRRVATDRFNCPVTEDNPMVVARPAFDWSSVRSAARIRQSSDSAFDSALDSAPATGTLNVTTAAPVISSNSGAAMSAATHPTDRRRRSNVASSAAGAPARWALATASRRLAISARGRSRQWASAAAMPASPSSSPAGFSASE